VTGATGTLEITASTDSPHFYKELCSMLPLTSCGIKAIWNTIKKMSEILKNHVLKTETVIKSDAVLWTEPILQRVTASNNMSTTFSLLAHLNVHLYVMHHLYISDCANKCSKCSFMWFRIFYSILPKVFIEQHYETTLFIDKRLSALSGVFRTSN
jgi:hypothetical protein